MVIEGADEEELENHGIVKRMSEGLLSSSAF